MSKVSSIIHNECCGVGLSLCNSKSDLVEKISIVENERDFLENQLNNAIKEINRLKRLTNV